MKRYQVILEQPAIEDIDSYYLRAVAAGAGTSAARWYDRIFDAILSLEFAPEWRTPVPEQDLFDERLHQVIFEGRYRIIYTVVEERVHVLCVRGAGMREIRPEDIEPSARHAGDN